VSGIGSADDANALFLVMEGSHQLYQQRGTTVQCGDIIRLQHIQTKKFLSSHRSHASPLSRQQEVACIQDGRHQEASVDWQIICSAVEGKNKSKGASDEKDKCLARDRAFRLKHVQSGFFLTLVSDKVYTQPIQGQVEIVAQARETLKGTLWLAGEGVYFASSQPQQQDL
jgi:dolichyl-phosphate-mannose--protein O-mannosyl transferase